MKRLLSLLLVIAMLFGICAMFTACDSNNASSEEKEEEKEENKTVKLNMKKTAVEETVLYEDNDIVLTLNSLEVSEYDVAFLLDLENNSDVTICVQFSDCIVNGISSVPIYGYYTVEPGDTVEAVLHFDIASLQLLSMKTIGDLEFGVSIRDDDNYEYIEEYIRLTIKTSDTGYQHVPNSTGEELFNKEGLRIVLLKTVLSTKKGAYMHLYIENTNTEKLTVDLDNVSVNGWLLTAAYIYEVVMPGTNTVCSLYLDELLELGITKQDSIQNMYFDLNAFNADYDDRVHETHVGYIPGDANYIHEIEVDGTILYEDNGLLFVLADIKANKDGFQISLYIKNTSGEFREFAFSDIFVNGGSDYSSISGMLPANTQSLRALYMWYTDEYPSFDDISEIAGTLRVYNDSYDLLDEDAMILPLD